jgi:hypothetical protein
MKSLQYIILSVLFFSFGSCQKEEETIVQDTSESFVFGSPMADLLLRVSQNPTAIDNILDNTSCFSVQLPVTVIVNGQQILVSNQADYQTRHHCDGTPHALPVADRRMQPAPGDAHRRSGAAPLAA